MVGKVSRALIILGFVVASVMAFGWSSPATVAVGLLGTTALIMGGTAQPFVNPYNRQADVDGLPSYCFVLPGLVDANW